LRAGNADKRERRLTGLTVLNHDKRIHPAAFAGFGPTKQLKSNQNDNIVI
jgi:hypothetical protein